MTIEEVEQWAKQNKFTIIADEWWDAAQDIIRKYQKIQEIVQSKTTMVSYDIVFRQIKEVVADGNDN